jgi:HAMP domain-containing protein
MFKKLRLGLKFSLILGLVFLGGTLLSGSVLSKLHMETAQNKVSDRANIVMEIANAARTYTSNGVAPLIERYVDLEQELPPESIPSYSSREIVENFRDEATYRNFYYKDATLNPTNPRDKADPFEADLVGKFRQNGNLKELNGFRELSGENLFYIARPLIIKNGACLRCHNTPETAPKSLIDAYGSDGGFGWNLNEIIGAQVVYVPAEDVFQAARRNGLLSTSVFVGIFLIAILLINWLIKYLIVKPIEPMAKLARRISEEHPEPGESLPPQLLDKVARRYDELGQLARIFKRMAEAVYIREQSFTEQMQQLQQENFKAKQIALATGGAGNQDISQLLQRSRQIRQSNDNGKLDLHEMLQRVPLFESLSQPEIQSLIQIGHHQLISARECVFRQGDAGDAFYVILLGTVEIYAEQLGQRLRLMSSGEFFGELSLLLGIPRTATVRAIENVQLFLIDRDGLQGLLQNNPPLADRIADNLEQYQEELKQRQELLGQDDRESFVEQPMKWIRSRMKQLFHL